MIQAVSGSSAFLDNLTENESDPMKRPPFQFSKAFLFFTINFEKITYVRCTAFKGTKAAQEQSPSNLHPLTSLEAAIANIALDLWKHKFIYFLCLCAQMASILHMILHLNCFPTYLKDLSVSTSSCVPHTKAKQTETLAFGGEKGLLQG